MSSGCVPGGPAGLLILLGALAGPLRGENRDETTYRLYVRKAFPRITVHGHFGFGRGEFRKPMDVACAPDGRIAVSDVESWSVTVFSKNVRALMVVNAAGGTAIPQTPVGPAPPATPSPVPRGTDKRPPDGLNVPLGLAFDPAGNLYVSEEREHVIRKYDPKGKLVGTFGGLGSGGGRFRNPRGIDVGPDGRIYVADYSNFRIQVLDGEFRFLREIRWKAGGRRPGAPGDVSVDSGGNIWAVYTSVHQAVKFDPEGHELHVVGGRGTAIDRMIGPRYLACGPGGDVFISDPYSHRFLQFDALGRYVYTYGFRGNSRGQFKHPMGIELDDRGSVYLADSENFRFQILRIDPFLGDLNLADQQYERKDYAGCLETSLRLLATNPYHPAARQRVIEISGRFAEEAQQQGRLTEVKEHLSRILEIEPSNARARRFHRWVTWSENRDPIKKGLLGLGALLTFLFLVSALIRVLKSP